MFYLKYGDIMPGKSIGKITLDMNFNQVRSILQEYEVEDRDPTWVLKAGDVHVWVLKNEDIVDQIMVFGDFEGKYAGLIGIGSTLADVREYLKVGWHDEFDAIVLDGVPGMCFQPDDSGEEEDDGEDDYDEFYELKEVIGYISVYKDVPNQADKYGLD